MLVVSCAALRLQAADLLLDVDLGVRGDVPELLDFGFELGDRLFEVEKRNGHECTQSPTLSSTGRRRTNALAAAAGVP